MLRACPRIGIRKQVALYSYTSEQEGAASTVI